MVGRWLWVACLVVAPSSALYACGSDDEGGGSGGSNADGSAGSAGSAGSGASGGAGGGGGSGATGGSGGASGAGGASGSSGASGSAGATDGGADADSSAGSGGADAGDAGDAGDAMPDGAQGVEIDFDPTSIPLSTTSFPTGIQSGDMQPASAIVWTRYLGTEPLTVRVYAPTTPGKALLFHEATATPSADGYVHVDATGLPWHTELAYVFLTGTAPGFSGRSVIGRFVSAPAPGQKPPVRFGGSSCIDNGNAPFETLDRAGTENFDFFVFAGDTTYNDSATTLAQYRALWLGQIGHATFQKTLVSTGHYATWDDHEVDNDWNPETFSQTRLAAATQTFFEHLAIRRNTTSPNRIWRRYSWGDSIEVFVLDSRSERKPSTAAGPNAEYLSTAQMAWLKSGLETSTATFKVIVNSVPITNFPLLWDFYAIDRWEGYPAQRSELINHIVDKNIGGVLFVSGDFHLGASTQVEPSGKGSTLREVLMGPGDQGANPLWSTLPSPQFEFKTGTNNYTVFEADPNATPPTIKVTFVNGTGAKLFEKIYSF